MSITEKRYDDPVTMKIHRAYSKEESISYLLEKISELKVEIGVLKSEKSELEHEVKVLSKLTPSQKADSIYKKELQAVQTSQAKLKIDLEVWMTRAIQSENKLKENESSGNN